MSSDSLDFRAILFDYLYKYFISRDLPFDDRVAILDFVEYANLESFKDVLDERYGVTSET